MKIVIDIEDIEESLKGIDQFFRSDAFAYAVNIAVPGLFPVGSLSHYYHDSASLLASCITVQGSKRKLFNLSNPFKQDIMPHWQRWCHYKRLEKKGVYSTQAGEQAALNRLHKISDGNFDTAVAIIDESIAQGYKGLFPLKQGYGNTKKVTGADVSAGSAFKKIDRMFD